MEKILVVGGAGFIGSMLVPMLAELGYGVEVIDLFWFGDHLPQNTAKIKKNLFKCTKEELSGFDQVIFLAGLSNDPMAEFNPALNFTFNGALPSFLAYLAKEAGVRRFIYASSCSVYGYADDDLYDEEAPTISSYPYGIAKLQGERGCMQLCDENFSVVVLRQGTVVGNSPRMRLDLIINAMFLGSFVNKKIIVNNPSIWRPIIDIRDTCSAFIRAIQSPAKVHGIFNVAFDNYTVGQVAEIVQKETEQLIGHKVSIEIRNKLDFRNYKVSTEKSRVTLGFRPIYDIENTVSELFKCRDKFLPNYNDPQFYNVEVFKNLNFGDM